MQITKIEKNLDDAVTAEQMEVGEVYLDAREDIYYMRTDENRIVNLEHGTEWHIPYYSNDDAVYILVDAELVIR